MSDIIRLQNVSKSFGSTVALNSVSLEIPAGRIVGLVGPNGAGKTTLLRTLTGEIGYNGSINVLGLNPSTQRAELMASTGVIHDIAVMPPWMKVSYLLDYMDGIHPKFNRERCEALLAETSIKTNRKVRQLSKGMKTQLHLSLVLATDSRLLVLDEPTHGLDILFRKKLYSSVLEDYYDKEKSILISTHQVEEVEHILSDVIFLREGQIMLYTSMDDLRNEFIQVTVPAEKADEIKKLKPLSEQTLFGKKVFLLRGADKEALGKVGDTQVPSVADVFVALMGGAS